MSSSTPKGQFGKRIVVGVGDMQAASKEAGIITTSALGSCMGLTVYDPVAKVGGMLHYMLVQPQEREKARANPHMYALSGVPALFRAVQELGGVRGRLIVCAAGGAEIMDDEDGHSIGKRNHSILRRLFWKNGIVLHAEDCGGHAARLMSLDLATGKVTSTIQEEETQLWPR
ncbi:MAG: chemotaxis protein CheD [Planctomycetota bacterium]|nr:chemotaxis protein CheD [Planctomycetota bacterium]MDG2144142.1 chemotaxis protein CheD [Planctomycetota bacterium]